MAARGLSALLIATFLSAGSAQPQTPATTGSVTGTVRGVIGQAIEVIPGAPIFIKVGGKQKTIVSNTSGVWRIDGLKPGTASMRVRLSGFVSRRTETQIVADQVVEWNVTLRPEMMHHQLEPVGPDPTDPALVAGVYSVVLKRMILGSLKKPTVVTTSLLVPYQDDEEWPETLTMVPAAVRRTAATPEAQQPVTLRAESLPSEAVLIDHRTAPKAPAARLSRVFFSEDRLGALVVFTQSCPTRCGRGELLWLQRKSPADSWKVHTAHLLWIE
jgi:hypothetical protein